MRNYIYIVTGSSHKRGYNRAIRVYELVDGGTRYVGDDDKIQTASYRGDKAEAKHIISAVDKIPMLDAYNFVEEGEIQLTAV